MTVPTIEETQGGNWKKLLQGEEVSATAFLQKDLERAEARLVPFTPYTPDERLKALGDINFRPHGLYMPRDAHLQGQIKAVLAKIGSIPDEQVDLRLSKYHELQRRTEALEQQGEPGAWEGQQAVVRSKARFRLIAWGRRSGKTEEASAEAVAYAQGRPRSVVWIAAPVMDPLVARGFDKVMRRIDDLGIKTVIRRDSAQTKLVVLENGSRIEGVSLENISSVAGAAVDLAIIDEAAQIDPRAWYRAIIPPLMDRRGQALLLSSFEGAEGFFYEKSREEGSDNWEIFGGATYDLNFYMFPQGLQTPALVQAQKEMPKLEFLEQFGAIPMGIRDRVWPEFRTRVHTGRFGYDADHPVILAVDPSGGGSPYAAIAIQDYGEWFKIIDEFYQPYVTTEYVGSELDKRPWRDAVTEVIIDPAHPDESTRWHRIGYPALGAWEKPRIVDRLPLHRNALRDPGRFRELYRVLVNQILADSGLEPDADLEMDPRDQYAYYLQVEEALSDSKMSDEMVEALRKCSRLFINTATCPNTIMEHEKYRYPKKRQTWLNLKENPADAYNHCLVAGTEVETIRGPVPIEKVQMGDCVLTRKGYRRVTWAGMTDADAVVWDVTLSDGRVLSGTSEHPVWVVGIGWAEIFDVRVGDELFSISCEKINPSSHSSTEASPFTAIQNRLAGLIGSTLSRISTTSKQVWDGYTKKFGKTTLVPSLPNTTSTTKITTHLITDPITWNYAPGVTTAPTINKNVWQIPSTGLGRSNTLTASVPYLSPGTVLMTGSPGTVNTEKMPTPSDSLLRKPATSAVKPINPSPCDPSTSSAPATVKPLPVEHPGWTMKIVPAYGAGRPLESASISVPSVAPVHAVRIIDKRLRKERCPVYDLTVADQHEFFANGILVHNCMDATGYFLWLYKRFDKAFTEGDFSFLAPSGLSIFSAPREDTDGSQPVQARTPATRGALFLDHLRTTYTPHRNSSFLEVAR